MRPNVCALPLRITPRSRHMPVPRPQWQDCISASMSPWLSTVMLYNSGSSTAVEAIVWTSSHASTIKEAPAILYVKIRFEQTIRSFGAGARGTFSLTKLLLTALLTGASSETIAKKDRKISPCLVYPYSDTYHKLTLRWSAAPQAKLTGPKKKQDLNSESFNYSSEVTATRQNHGQRHYYSPTQKLRNLTTGCVTFFVTFCEMSQKTIDIIGYGPRPCGV